MSSWSLMASSIVRHLPAASVQTSDSVSSADARLGMALLAVGDVTSFSFASWSKAGRVASIMHYRRVTQ